MVRAAAEHGAAGHGALPGAGAEGSALGLAQRAARQGRSYLTPCQKKPLDRAEFNPMETKVRLATS
jgi:hypothetical protein